jgi:mannose-6-phosphate isomerase-like protein (cupin superfamily)
MPRSGYHHRSVSETVMTRVAAQDPMRSIVHFLDDGRGEVMPIDDRFWQMLGEGAYPALEQGRMLSAFSFDADWNSWERHPAGEELVMLLSGQADVVLDLPEGEQVIALRETGQFVLVPANTWHTARTTVATTMLFLTPGAGTDHRPVGG